MDSNERKAFWDVLCSIHDSTPEQSLKLYNTIKLPKYLCRFRTVSESSLKQLQENKMYYSSADYYDDPFDTFIHINFPWLREMYSFINDNLRCDNSEFLNTLSVFGTIIGISGEQFLNNLRENPLNLPCLEEDLKNYRTTLQKNLFSICFCENELNETLWIKYANNYKGFTLVYDIKSEDTFLCGKEDLCKNCHSMIEKPSIYPVYYSEDTYDATKFALACALREQAGTIPSQMIELLNKAMIWEAERISLIKKKCHEYDEEWRMIRPTMMPNRTCIKMKPYKIILGLRMPEYERLLTIAAAKIAGVCNIEELFINEYDRLDSRTIK